MGGLVTLDSLLVEALVEMPILGAFLCPLSGLDLDQKNIPRFALHSSWFARSWPLPCRSMAIGLRCNKKVSDWTRGDACGCGSHVHLIGMWVDFFEFGPGLCDSTWSWTAGLSPAICTTEIPAVCCGTCVACHHWHQGAAVGSFF